MPNACVLGRVAIFAAVAVALVALSPPAEAKTRSDTLDSGEVTAALLTLRDLPFRHWQYVAVLAPPSTGRCNGPTAAGRAENAGVMARGSVRFRGDLQLGPSVDEDIYVFPNKDRAGAFMSASKMAALSCTTTRLSSSDGWEVTTLRTYDSRTCRFSATNASQSKTERASPTHRTRRENSRNPRSWTSCTCVRAMR